MQFLLREIVAIFYRCLCFFYMIISIIYKFMNGSDLTYFIHNY